MHVCIYIRSVSKMISSPFLITNIVSLYLRMSSKSRPHHQGKPLKFKKDENQDQQLMTIAPKDLTIVWGGDERYWNVPKNVVSDETKTDPAELYQVSWLEVTGCVYQTDPKEDYEVGFELSLNPDAFGWGGAPVFVMVKRGKKGKFSWIREVLDTDKELKVKLKADGSVKEPLEQRKEKELGDEGQKEMNGSSEGSAEDSSEDEKVYFGLYEVWSGKWKGGMKIHKAFIRKV